MIPLTKSVNVLPRPFVRGLRNAWLGVLDLRDRLLGLRNDLTPPRRLHYVGDGDSKATGRTFLEYFVDIGKLGPEEAVLDIGCGTGRMAIPLLDYLDNAGRYIGFDVSPDAIRWCRDHLAVRNTRFAFVHADIRNLEYNPHGAIAASDFTFPCGNQSIGFAFATSVFTHLRPDDVQQYLSEISRVLKPAGTALLTFFIIDEMARRLINDKRASLNFTVNLGDFFTIDRQTPERAIAYSEAQLMRFLREAKLALVSPIHYGSWSGRPQECLTMQDMVVVRRA
jgi:ubiquinone/menaquinone biosynthesis C-methylase UbiE